MKNLVDDISHSLNYLNKLFLRKQLTIMMKILLLFFGLSFIISCSPKYVSFTAQRPEEISTNKLQSFLNETKNPNVVLRVPNTGETTSSIENEGYYITIEKEFLKNGFTVRDRALFTEVLEKSKNEIDYKELGLRTETDLIIELVKFDAEVLYETNIYKTSLGKEGTLKNPFRYYGAEIEFKLILIQNNEFAGSYRYHYAPCSSGCLVDKGLEEYFKFKRKRTPKYKIVEKSDLEEFTVKVTNDLIRSLR